MTVWPFSFKHSLLSSGFLQGWTDWHCHILPGVDDGIRSMEKALKVLAFYEEAGVSAVWLTPHVMEDIPNAPSALRERLLQLKKAYLGPVRLHLASEHMMDNLFENRLERGDVLPIGEKERYILVETSYFNPPMDLHGVLDRIFEKGFFPVLAHPERYAYMEKADYAKLKERGILFQLNLPSLCGGYGREAAHKAAQLLSEGMYDLCGSDLHRLAAFRDAVTARVHTAGVLKKLLALKTFEG